MTPKISKNAKSPKNPIRSSLSPTTRAIFDLLADEELHGREEVLSIAMVAALGEDYLRCVEEGKRARRGRPATLQEYAHSGARHFARNNLMIAERNRRVITTGKNENALCRMPVTLAREWTVARAVEKENKPREAVAKQPFGDITLYAGMTEWEGWAYAPLVARDIAHVRPALSIPMERLVKAFPGWEIIEGPDGLISISAHVGAPVKEVVTQWFTDNDLHHDGVRDAKKVRRRDLTQLPSTPNFADLKTGILTSFYRDLLDKNIKFGLGLINSRHSASMQKLVGDKDDIKGYLTVWILELASSFDANLGRPFGTWLTNQLPRKIQDLNRATHGRTASDAEIKHARARTDFEAQYGRTASSDELREILGYTKDEMRSKRRHLSNLAGMRSASPLDTGPDEADIQITDERANPERDVLDRERARQISLALLSASGTYDPILGRPIMTKPLGFLVIYLMTWDEWVKGDLVILAGCADRKATDEVEAVQLELAHTLSDLKDHAG